MGTSLIWLDGKLLPAADAHIPFGTHGLHYGSAVFEGIRVYQGKIYQLQEHVDRLLQSAAIMDMQPIVTAEEIMAGCKAVVDAAGFQEGYIRPLIWRGSKTLRICAPDSDIVTGIIAWGVPSSMPTKEAFYHKTPIRLIMAPWRRPAPDTAPYKAKASGLYVIATLSAHEARKQGFDDALMLDYRGLLAEGTSSNLFLVIKGEIHTPIADCFLDGLTRQTVIQIARKAGITVHERHISPEELKQAEEVFMTGTTSEIAPVGQIDDQHYTTGPVTRQVMSLFYDHVMANI